MTIAHRTIGKPSVASESLSEFRKRLVASRLQGNFGNRHTKWLRHELDGLLTRLQRIPIEIDLISKTQELIEAEFCRCESECEAAQVQ